MSYDNVMPPRRPGQNLLREKPKKKIVISPSIRFLLSKSLQFGIVVALLFFIVTSGWQYIYKMISESYVPNAKSFEECSGSFINIKTKPTYGVVFKTKNQSITSLYLTAPDGVASVKSIKISGTDWVPVYFSNNFTMTQVSEFLRLSRLETGKDSYCHILNQLALTSGVPVEYVVVEDEVAGISSSMSIAHTQELLAMVDRGKQLTFNKDLLGLRTLDDGSKVVVTTFESFQEQFPSFFVISEISQEQAFVEVYNATSEAGYASIFSRKWSMLGIDISRIGNAAHEEVGENLAVVYVKNEQQYARTLAMIKSSFPPGKVLVRSGRPANLVTTGDIVVFLLKR